MEISNILLINTNLKIQNVIWIADSSSMNSKVFMSLCGFTQDLCICKSTFLHMPTFLSFVLKALS